MSYTVVWNPDAERELAEAWLNAPDQALVTRTAHGIEQVLAREPLTYGESRKSSVSRVAFESPLGIDFEVIEDDKRVIVTSVWLIS
jgi:hypothetical protein